jgi:uncharacterized protein YggU (UPF0235/DUF167 family)
VRVTVWVRPGSRRPTVGGDHGGALVVAVAEQAERGRATHAAGRALATALGVPSSRVRLVSGPTSRTKVFEVDGATAEQVEALRAG